VKLLAGEDLGGYDRVVRERFKAGLKKWWGAYWILFLLAGLFACALSGNPCLMLIPVFWMLNKDEWM
jgi:hypothetical protein